MNEGVLYVQTFLKRVGFDPGVLDGKWGRNTRNAFDAYTKSTQTIIPEKVIKGERVNLIFEQPKASRNIEGIVIHCTAGFNPSDAAGIRKMHMTKGWQGSPNGWSDIGYHYVVKTDGTIEKGRPEAMVGAHTKGANSGTLGIVYVGGVDLAGKPQDTRTDEQKTSLINLCNSLIDKYPTIKWIKGHNDFTNMKACPSFKVGNDPLGRLI